MNRSTKKLTQEEAVLRMKEASPEFNYDKFIYVNGVTKGIVLCPVHGEFMQNYKRLSKGIGCAKCGGVHKKTTEEYLQDIRKKFGPLYDTCDFSKVLYETANSRIQVICKVHGEFTVKAADYLNAHIHPCPKCGVENRSTSAVLTQNEFLIKALIVHDGRYTYLKAIYKGYSSDVVVTCQEHGDFIQKAGDHLEGKGCRKCAGNTLLSPEEYFRRVHKIHSDRYSYVKESFRNTSQPIQAMCHVGGHGAFTIHSGNHLYHNAGCPKCGAESRAKRRRLSLTEILEGCILAHGYAYDYSETNFASITNLQKDLISIRCVKHDEVFTVVAANHLYGNGTCPKCRSGGTSKGEDEIAAFIVSLGFEVVRGNRKVLQSGKEIDIWVPSANLGVEYHGLYWHSEDALIESRNLSLYQAKRYHLDKFISANASEVRLVQIFADEWADSSDKIRGILTQKLGKATSCTYARNTSVVIGRTEAAKSVLDMYHLQSSPKSSTYWLSLVDANGKTVSVMTFGTSNTAGSNIIELERFASVGKVPGGFSKLLSWFKRTYGRGFSSIVSYSDNRIGTGEVYHVNGFDFKGESGISYYWVKGARKYHRRVMQRANLPKVLDYFDPDLSESENCKANGYSKIWDAGKRKWEMKL